MQPVPSEGNAHKPLSRAVGFGLASDWFKRKTARNQPQSSGNSTWSNNLPRQSIQKRTREGLGTTKRTNSRRDFPGKFCRCGFLFEPGAHYPLMGSCLNKKLSPNDIRIHLPFAVSFFSSLRLTRADSLSHFERSSAF